MINLSVIKVKEFREKINSNKELQNFIKNILIVSGNHYNNGISKRAFYAVVYFLLGNKSFPVELRNELLRCMNEGTIEKTFLDRNNYEQRVYGFFSTRNKQTKKYVDIYYGDKLLNLGQGKKADVNGRGLSEKRLIFFRDEVLNLTLNEAILSLEKHLLGAIDDSEKQSKIKDFYNVRELIVSLSEHFSLEDYMDYSTQKKDEYEINNNLKLSELEKEMLIQARRGQGRFRAAVLQRNGFCPFTGIDDPHLLIASHIKPWKMSSNDEKLDPNNGFALTPTYDRLFDKGYISFCDDKTLLISSKLESKYQNSLNLKATQQITDLKISDKCREYLKYHREYVFILNNSILSLI